MANELSLPSQPWANEAQDICTELAAVPDKGLDDAEARNRRGQFGPNRLREARRRSLWEILLEQFKSLVVLLLVAAAAVSFAFGEWVEGTAIVVVVIINAALGFFTELRAVRSMEALKKMGRVSTKVRRRGQVREVGAEELVPGDIVLIEGGDIITADLRLVEASKLQANESALTGESAPVSKQVAPLAVDTPLAERANMLFKGTAVTRGAGEGVVVATGMETELGRISSLVEEAEDESTPLEQRLDQLGRKLIWITLVIAAAVAVIGIVQGKDLFLMIEISIALAVAAVPEGLPIVATIALAHGMRRMADRNALVNRLAAVETLGGTTVICTDKTGTLTENQMTVTRLAMASGEIEIGGEGLAREGEFRRNGESVDPAGDDLLRQALEVGVLCNNASLPERKPEGGDNAGTVGDPVEVALLVAGAKAGLDRSKLVDRMPEAREEAFDADTKMMATFHEQKDRFRVAVKGAPEPVLDASALLLTDEGPTELTDDLRQRWLDRNREMAEKGLRVLALASKTVDSTKAAPYEALEFLGLVGFVDPPRGEVKGAIAACRDAGIRVVMVTGDQPATALNIGRALGLVNGAEADVIHGRDLRALAEGSPEERRRILEAPILARVSPEQKLDLIAVHQQNNATVAMTGDGVNDAPALKKADIGIAMGQRGTQVAREAADMVLKDDAFSTIVVAVEQGRVIFDNIRKFVLYLLSCNLSEIMTVGLASLFNAPLPVLPLQILFLNLVTDVFPALALGVGEGNPHVMKRPPRDPEEPIMTRRHWYRMGGYGLLITAAVLGALALALKWLGMAREQAVTVSFLTLAFAQLWHVFNMRDRESNLLRNEITRNPYVWGALSLCILLLLLAVYLPGLSDVLKVVDPGLSGWALVAVMSLLPLVLGQLGKMIKTK
jgi:P-type Ca2+ transporter type 2C